MAVALQNKVDKELNLTRYAVQLKNDRHLHLRFLILLKFLDSLSGILKRLSASVTVRANTLDSWGHGHTCVPLTNGFFVKISLDIKEMLFIKLVSSI